MDYSIINKYLFGTASEAEIEKIYNWIDSDPENKKEFIQYKKAWALTSEINVNSTKVWEKEIHPILKKSVKKRGSTARYLKIAASIAILLSLGALVHFAISTYIFDKNMHATQTKIEVPLGQMANVMLPDGSMVQLNSGSALEYSSNFHTGNRNVSLSGEAFFDVFSDKKHPFKVQTNALDFQVYGTSFNIQAYTEDNTINATLVEGSLGVLNKSGKEMVKLTPGKNCIYSKEDNALFVRSVNTELYTSWKDGVITFRNQTLGSIAQKIERWYNVKIVFQNPQTANETYMGTIMKSKPVDQILEVLSKASSFEYRIITKASEPSIIYIN